MLDIQNLHTGYGETEIIHGLDLNAPKAKVLAILGRNGAGKTTTLKSIMGLLAVTRGAIVFDGQDITHHAPFEIARIGIAYVPETRDIFPSLSVRENLELAARLTPFGERLWTFERILDFFPGLSKRLENGGNQLSGGEQQMLAIGRALLMNPKLLVLDEPTEGLAPIIIKQIHDKLLELKNEGMTMVLVEQNFGFATSLSDEVCIIGRGKVVWKGPPEDVRSNRDLQTQWLGV